MRPGAPRGRERCGPLLLVAVRVCAGPAAQPARQAAGAPACKALECDAQCWGPFLDICCQAPHNVVAWAAVLELLLLMLSTELRHGCPAAGMGRLFVTYCAHRCCCSSSTAWHCVWLAWLLLLLLLAGWQEAPLPCQLQAAHLCVLAQTIHAAGQTEGWYTHDGRQVSKFLLLSHVMYPVPQKPSTVL